MLAGGLKDTGSVLTDGFYGVEDTATEVGLAAAWDRFFTVAARTRYTSDERCGLIALQAKEIEVKSEGTPERDSTACYQSDGPTEIDSQRYQSEPLRRMTCTVCLGQLYIIACANGTERYQRKSCPRCRGIGIEPHRVSGERQDKRTPPADW